MEFFYCHNKAVQDFTTKLANLNRSAFPVAIRKTLNTTALDVKKNTMIKESDKAFIKRKPTFFQATSRVEFAEGFDVDSMGATVGFVAPGNIKESGHATEDLEEQEYGGAIDKRAFIATKDARTALGNVRDGLTMGRIKPYIVDSLKQKGRATGHLLTISLNKAQQFIVAAMNVGNGGFVIGTDRRNGARALMQIKSIKREGGKTFVNSKEIYTVKAHRKAHVRAIHFMEEATAQSYRKMPMVFGKYAEEQFEKVLRPK